MSRNRNCRERNGIRETSVPQQADAAAECAAKEMDQLRKELAAAFGSLSDELLMNADGDIIANRLPRLNYANGYPILSIIAANWDEIRRKVKLAADHQIDRGKLFSAAVEIMAAAVKPSANKQLEASAIYYVSGELPEKSSTPKIDRLTTLLSTLQSLDPANGAAIGAVQKNIDGLGRRLETDKKAQKIILKQMLVAADEAPNSKDLKRNIRDALQDLSN